MQQPTVLVLIGTPVGRSAIAFEEGTDTFSGEILETVDFNEDGTPDWSAAGICDYRGAGGPLGYEQLRTALNLLEQNAETCGYEIVRVPKEVAA